MRASDSDSRGTKGHSGADASKPKFIFLCLGGYLFSIAYGVTFLIPLMVIERGGDEAFAGVIISTATIGTVSLVILSGHIADRFGTARSAAISGLLLALSMLGFFLSQSLSHGLIDNPNNRLGYDLLLYALLLGMGWGVFYTLAPILVSAIIPSERRMRFFALLSGSMMSGIGTGPLIGRLTTYLDLPIETAFSVACVCSLVGSGIYFYLDNNFRRNNGLPPHISRISLRYIYRIFHSNAIFPISMVGLGACIFGGLSSFQTTYAETFGFDYSLFFGGFILSAISGRLFLSGYVSRFDPFLSTFFLTFLIVVSIFMFIRFTNDVYLYVFSSAVLGIGYGLAYSVINGLAANEAPAGLVPQSLLLFSLSYFIGVFGFPLIAGGIIVQNGVIDMLYILLGVALLNNFLSILRIWQQRSSIFSN